MIPKYVYRSFAALLLLVGLIAVSCSDESIDTFDRFLNVEDVSVVGKINGITGSVAGNRRVEFKVAISADPRITKGQVTWVDNSGEEKVHEYDIQRNKDGLDTLLVAVPDVDEGFRRFRFIMIDGAGRQSSAVQFGREVYGPGYESNLVARRPETIEAFEIATGDSLAIRWSTLPTVLETVMRYTDLDGIEQQITFDKLDKETNLENYDITKPYTLVSQFLPEPDALDTFTSPVLEGFFPTPIVVLDKSLWSKVDLPNDLPLVAGSPGNTVDKLWDGDRNSRLIVEGNPADNPPEGFSFPPYHFTFDIGAVTQVTKLDGVGFLPFDRITPGQYQIWAIDDLTDAETTIDLQDLSMLTDEEKADPDAVAAQLAQNLADWQEESTEKGWTLIVNDNSTNRRDWSEVIVDSGKYRYFRWVTIRAHDPIANGATAWNEITLHGFRPQ
ncbi:DUF4998 domain-containing protein [Maribacter sp. 2304DJ31-5]|uniref:DUF4998 domain-containing protein n=1 Tax=Maribacter sp. 2304DJ31-5 TaxID=3386273 RepID=UPI0039BCFDCC